MVVLGVSKVNSMLTLREEIMKLIVKEPYISINGLAARLQKTRSEIKDKLFLLRRDGMAKDQMVRKENPLGGLVLTHVWYPTKEGIKWSENL